MVGQVKYKYKGDNVAPTITSNLLSNGVITGGSVITKLAVQAPIGTQIRINDKSILVGYTRIYQLPDDVEVTSIYFVDNGDLKDILIDYIVE